jgi:Amt family ammonium transporter
VIQPAQLSDLQFGLCVVFLSIAPLSCAGLALINTGLGRSRNAAHSMMSALCVISVACLVYFICGRSWQGSLGEQAHIVLIKGKAWDWLGATPAFFAGLFPNAGQPHAYALLTAWMGMIAVALAGLIPLGSGAERWRLNSICASTALLAGWTFPVFAHWAWGGGWMAKLGSNYGLGMGYVDAGGAGVIHATGGLTALAMVWILGARRGKYGSDGMPMAIPGHNAVLVLTGCILAAAGWLGLNGAGAILFGGVEPGQVVLLAVNTILAASAGALAAAVITRARFGMPDASLSANGWVGGLVAVSAGCAFLPSAAAVLVGLIAGALVPFSVEVLELRLEVDDPGGSISVHAVAGIWGVLAVGLFGRFPGNSSGQFLAQLVGVATLFGFVLPVSWGANYLLNRFVPCRATREGERQGMDLFELGAGAYPDFITHNDEYSSR